MESEYQPKYESVFKRSTPETDSEQVVETNNATVPATVPEMRITTQLKGKDGFKQLEKLYEQELEKRGIDKTYAK